MRKYQKLTARDVVGFIKHWTDQAPNDERESIEQVRYDHCIPRLKGRGEEIDTLLKGKYRRHPLDWRVKITAVFQYDNCQQYAPQELEAKQCKITELDGIVLELCRENLRRGDLEKFQYFMFEVEVIKGPKGHTLSVERQLKRQLHNRMTG